MSVAGLPVPLVAHTWASRAGEGKGLWALTSPPSRVRLAGKGEEARDGFWPRTAGVPGPV